jgi:hypothetical protein
MFVPVLEYLVQVGFKLLAFDVRVASGLAFKAVKGNQLTRYRGVGGCMLLGGNTSAQRSTACCSMGCRAVTAASSGKRACWGVADGSSADPPTEPRLTLVCCCVLPVVLLLLLLHAAAVLLLQA